MGDTLEYSDVLQEVRGAMNPGRLKLQKGTIVFKNIKTGIVETLQSSDLEEATWLIRARGYCLKVLSSGGNVHRFDGLKESDFEKLSSFFKSNYDVSLKKKDIAIKGWNWGVANFVGNALEFDVDKQAAFDVPLNYVSHSVTSKNEVTLEFHQNDDAAVSLTELRFHVPSDPANPEKDTVDEFYQNVLSKADIIQATGDALTTFTEVHCLTPRGRYDIKIYQTFMQLHGKTFDYKIPYTTILRLFLLPHKDNRQMFFVVSVDPPIKQGQTRYHFLILLFNKEFETQVEIGLSDKDLEEKYEGKLTKNMSGPEYEIISRIMKTLVNRKITVPGTFVGHSGAQSIACSYKAATGFLYPLERGFIFVHKPPIHIRFDEVSNVNFARSSGSNRSFDFEVETKTGSPYIFNGIEKDEYGKLYDFVKHKKLRVKNIGDKLNKGATYDDMMGSDDEGQHDAYMHRMKIEGQERDEDDEDDESEEDEDFNPGENVSEPDDEFDSNPESTDSEGGSGEEGEDSPKKEKKKKVEKKEKKEKKERKSKSSSEPKTTKRKGKKDNDPTKPKRPMTAYFIWLNANRDQIKKDNPGLSLTELSKKGGEMWREMSSSDKKEWEAKSAAAKAEYEEAMREWEKQPKGSHSTSSSSPRKPAESTGGSGGGFKSREFIENDDSSDDGDAAPPPAKPSPKGGKRKKKEEDAEASDASSSSDKPLKASPPKKKKNKKKKEESESEEEPPPPRKREKRQPGKATEEKEDSDVDEHAGLPSDESEAEMTDESEGDSDGGDDDEEEEASGSGSDEESD